MNSLPSSLGLIAGCLLAGSTSNWAASISNKSTPLRPGRVSAGVYETIVSFDNQGRWECKLPLTTPMGRGLPTINSKARPLVTVGQANEDEARACLWVPPSWMACTFLPDCGEPILDSLPVRLHRSVSPSANYAGSDQFSYRITDGKQSACHHRDLRHGPQRPSNSLLLFVTSRKIKDLPDPVR